MIGKLPMKICEQLGEKRKRETVHTIDSQLGFMSGKGKRTPPSYFVKCRGIIMEESNQ